MPKCTDTTRLSRRKNAPLAWRFFTPDEVRAIRAWCVPGRQGTHNAFDRLHGVKATARKFGGTPQSVRRIVQGKTHKDVLDLEAAA